MVTVRIWDYASDERRELSLPDLPAGMAWEVTSDPQCAGHYAYTVRSRDGSCAVDIEMGPPDSRGGWRDYYRRTPTAEEVRRSIEAAGYWMQPDGSRGSTGESWWAERG